MVAQLTAEVEAPRRRPGRPRKIAPPPPPRPRRKPGTGSISVLASGRVYALDIRDADAAGHRESYEAVGVTVDARYADAERWLEERISRRARLAGQAPLTVREHVERFFWERYRAAPLGTQQVRRAHFSYAEPIGDLLVHDVTEAHINAITEEGRSAGLSARYLRSIRAALKTMFAPLVKAGTIAANPVGEFPGHLTVPKRRPNVWDFQDAADFELEALSRPHGLLFALMLRYGLRGGEVRALRKGDLVVATREILIRHGLGPGRVFGDTKTHTERSIRIVGRLMAGLEQLVDGLGAEAWLFVMDDGTPLTRHVLLDEFAEIVAAVNERRYREALAAGRNEAQAQMTRLAPLTPHGLRHTAATLMLRRRVALAKVAQILGHARISTTVDMYGWAVPSDDDQVDLAIESLLTPLPELPVVPALVSG